MLVWSGWGWLVLVIVLLAYKISDGIYKLAALPADSLFVKMELVAYFIIAALLSLGLDRALARCQRTRHLVDQQTGEEVVMTPNNHFCFIQVKYWKYVFLGLALLEIGKRVAYDL